LIFCRYNYSKVGRDENIAVLRTGSPRNLQFDIRVFGFSWTIKKGETSKNDGKTQL